MSYLEISKLSVDYNLEKGGILHALRGLTLAVESGEAIAIVGESGCGKSTLASSILKLLALNAKVSGRVVLDGRNILEMTGKELESVRGVKAGIIFQDPAASLNPVFSIKEQIEETISTHLKIKDKTKLEEMGLKLLEETGITDSKRVYHSYPHQLSGGQQQRVMTAIAMSCSPGLLIADEPTTALDVTVQAQIIMLLKRLKKERSLTLLLITHDLHLAMELCRRIVVMYAGEVVEDAIINDENSARHPYTRALFEIIPDLNEKPGNFRIIQGEVFDMKKDINECYFRERCERAGELCSSSHPELKNGVRCFYPFGSGGCKNG
jgi:oligopeptide/dipeptide ABC transporter ATP-binding protein